MLRIDLLVAVLFLGYAGGADAFISPRVPTVCSTCKVSTTRCSLFFAGRGEKQQQTQEQTRLTVSDEVAQVLQSSSLQLPYVFQNIANETLTIRHLEKRDLKAVVPICVKEFGTSPKPRRFPWKDLSRKSIDKWLESVMFGPLVGMSLRMKVQRRQQGYDDTLPDILPDYNVLCITKGDATIVGIVELSVQPLDPQRNPPPVPLPLFLKQAYCESRNMPPPDGWVSNLLIDNNSRGKGYSKALMMAVEGLAKKWGCTSISLHVDSDSVSGRIPQRLYERLGYEPVIDTSVDQKFDWMGPDILKSGLYIVEGVPLLFLRKGLKEGIYQC